MTGNAGDAAAQMQVMIGLRDWLQLEMQRSRHMIGAGSMVP